MNSPFKSTLFEFDFSSACKKVVSCEINGWMETNAKQKYASQPIHPSRYPKSTRIINSPPSQRTTFDKLKNIKNCLLKNTMRKFSELTPPTAQSHPHILSVGNSNAFISSQRKSVDRKECFKPKIIEVSQFKETHHSPIRQPQISKERKISVLRLRTLSKKGARATINHILLGKEADIIQSKVTEKQYCGLNIATRKITSRLRKC